MSHVHILGAFMIERDVIETALNGFLLFFGKVKIYGILF